MRTDLPAGQAVGAPVFSPGEEPVMEKHTGGSPGGKAFEGGRRGPCGPQGPTAHNPPELLCLPSASPAAKI